jgi:hypothetical protein
MSEFDEIRAPRRGACIIACACLVPWASNAVAGMPHYPTFSEIAEARLSIISFFCALYVLATLVFWLIWNSLQKDFSSMPRLPFRRAFVFVAVWAAAFILILTMISGARELMTPGAWEKSGRIYKLKSLSSR